MPKTIGGELVQEEKQSREADSVLLTAKNVYKIYSNDSAAWESYELYKKAEEFGVPVVSAARFSAPCDGKSVSGIISERASGRFFQLAKSGGEKVLLNEIGEITDKAKLTQVVNGLRAAADFGLSDAQGFIDPSADNPLVFIDVHSKGKWRPTKDNKKNDPDKAFEATRTQIFDDVIASIDKSLMKETAKA